MSLIKKSPQIAVIVLVATGLSSGQHGIAPPGYYPVNYSGSTFTGKLANIDGANKIALTHTKGDKTQTFEGILEAGCNIPNRENRRIMASDLPQRLVLTALYIPESEKVDGKKVKVNRIFAITFVEVNGQEILEKNRVLYYCTGRAPTAMHYKAF